MARPFNVNLLRTLDMTARMLELADDGERDHDDPSCAAMYGILRDMAYRLRKLAQDECERHQNTRKWD